MEQTNLDNILKVWKARNTILKPSEQTYDLDIVDQISSLFAPNTFYYYIINFIDYKFVHAGGAWHEILEIDKEEVTLEDLLNKLHPEDASLLYKKEQISLNFKLNCISKEEITKYKTVYLWRVLLKNGVVKTILHQAQALDVSEDGKVQNVLSVDVDVSHLNVPFDHNVSFISNDRPSYTGIDPEKPMCLDNSSFKNQFTVRELEVVEKISMGYSSKEIANCFDISEETVKTHRRNILKKSDCENILQLITKCIREGLI